jgi:hypothetical protein
MSKRTFNAVNPDGARSVPLPSADITGPAFERHFDSNEISQLWGLDPTTVRRIFQDRPGVLKLGKANRRDGKRDYVTLRIPQSVVEQVHRERSK